MALLDQENCIARLHALAVELSRHREGNVPVVLGQVLGVKPNTVEFHRRLVILEDLGKRARQQVDELADKPNYELYIQAIDPIVETLGNLNMLDNWNRYTARFNTEALTFLRACEREFQHLLATKHGRAVTPPSDEVLGGVLNDIREAINGVIQADIEAEAKQLLIKMLREAERAVLEYQISGVAGLRRAVERLVGMYALYEQRFKKYEGHNAVDRVFKALGRFVIVADMGGYLMQLPAGVDYIIKSVKMLTEGS